MCDKEPLVSYLYDELHGPDRKAFQQHLTSCRECQDEVQALRGTRAHLAAWRVPEPALGLQVPGPSASSSRFRLSPAWGLAAAAALVLAVASAIANAEVRVGADGVTIRTGWAPQAGPVAAATREDVTAIQQKVEDLEAALAAAQQKPPAEATPVSLNPGGAASGADRLTDAELLRRVRQWINDSEQRQEQVLAARLVQGMREMQAAHASDLVQLEQAINRSQATWTDEVFRQREEMKQVYRMVSAQQQR